MAPVAAWRRTRARTTARANSEGHAEFSICMSWQKVHRDVSGRRADVLTLSAQCFVSSRAIQFNEAFVPCFAPRPGLRVLLAVSSQVCASALSWRPSPRPVSPPGVTHCLPLDARRKGARPTRLRANAVPVTYAVHIGEQTHQAASNRYDSSPSVTIQQTVSTVLTHLLPRKSSWRRLLVRHASHSFAL